MPSVSKKQHNLMAAVANNPAFAKKAGIPQSVGSEFIKADKGKKFVKGGDMAAKPAKFAKGGFTKAADGIAKQGQTKAQRFAEGGMPMGMPSNLPPGAIEAMNRFASRPTPASQYSPPPTTRVATGPTGRQQQYFQQRQQEQLQRQQERLQRQQGRGKGVAFQANKPPTSGFQASTKPLVQQTQGGFKPQPPANRFGSYGFDQGTTDYLNKQYELSTSDAGVNYSYDPATQTFTGGTMGSGPVTKTLAQIQADAANYNNRPAMPQGGFKPKPPPPGATPSSANMASGFDSQFAKPMMTAAGPAPMGGAMKKGGAVKAKAYAKGGAVKCAPAKPAKTMARGGGCEVKGKTKGRYI